MLKIQKLAYRFHHRPPIAYKDWEAKPGDVVHLVGENGAGKSTLLKLIAGFLKPDFGEVTWQGLALRQQIVPCYLGHALGITEALSVIEHLDWYACLQRVNLTDNKRCHILKNLGLSEYRHHFPGQLSCGLRQRLSLSRFMLSKSPLWLMDEPATGLDAEGRDCLETLIKEFVHQGGIAVLSAHHALLNNQSIRVNITDNHKALAFVKGARW